MAALTLNIGHTHKGDQWHQLFDPVDIVRQWLVQKIESVSENTASNISENTASPDRMPGHISSRRKTVSIRLSRELSFRMRADDAMEIANAGCFKQG